jgi:tRNA modification GTPase
LRVLDQMQSHHIDDALQEIDQLILRSIYGARLLTGWRIGIVGPPNAGKSSFLNRILGYTRAIVHDTPGTTRDLLRERTSILGWPIEFIDTAGIRETECGVEAEGVCRAMGVLEECDLILLLVDPTQGVVKLHLQILEDYESKVLVIATKEDLFTADRNQASVQRALRHSHSLQTISSSMNLGIDEVLQKIIDRLVLQEVRFGRAVPFREDQIQVLQELRGKLISRKPKLT